MRIELLPHGKWNELNQALAESRVDDAPPKPGQSITLVARDDESIIGATQAERVWCVRLLWAAREHRGGGLPELLADSLAAYNTEGLKETLITTSPHIDKLVYNLGFRPLEGQLWQREK